MIGHEEMLDSVALLALGVLPEAEARVVAAHARDCATCRAEYAELRAAGDALGYAAEATPAEFAGTDAARLKARVMDAVRAPSLTAPANNIVTPLRARRATERDRSTWFAYGAAAAAVIFAVVSGANVVALRKQVDDDSAALARANALQAQVAELVAPGSKHYALADGEIVTSGGHVFLAIRNLPSLAPGKVYQAWTLHRGAHTMAPSITFTPANGAVTLIELPQPSTDLAAVAVSVEPAGGSAAPTSTPTFVRTLS